jgi:hypothetical protein
MIAFVAEIKRFGLAALVAGLAACASNSSTIPTRSQTPLQSGFMRVTVRVAGQLDFSTYQYGVTFNTTGSSLTPEFGNTDVDWKAYSATIESTSVEERPFVQVIRYISNPNDPHQPPQEVGVVATPSQLQFVEDTNTSAFTVTFERSLAVYGSGQPATTWRFNAYSRASNEVLDTMGSCPSCFKSPALPIATKFDQTIQSQGRSIVTPSARIVSVEFQNSP